MTRVRISTTVDPDLLERARALEAGRPDAALIESALRALVASHRRAEIDQAYLRAYADHPVDEADEWGDLASFARAVRAR